jgi:F-type H+-transporting ATPase subunit delta
MKNLAIARRYAKALLLIGQQDGKTEAYRGELQSISSLVAADAQLEQALNNPLYGNAARKRVLAALIAKAQLSKVVGSFLMLLFEKGRLGFLGAINDFYQKLADELKGVARASVISAGQLSADAAERIRSALSQRTGKDIILDIKQDSSLIGGIITQIGDLVLDGSIKSQLLNMRESLKRSEGV